MAARRRGEDIIDFGMGNPDGPTPQHIVDKLIETVAAHGHPRLLGVARHPAAAPGDLPLVRAPLRRRVRPGNRSDLDHRLEGRHRSSRARDAGPRRHRARAESQLSDPHLRTGDRGRRHPARADDAERGFLRGARERDPHAVSEAEDADHQLSVESDGAVRRAAVLREDRRARPRARHLGGARPCVRGHHVRRLEGAVDHAGGGRAGCRRRVLHDVEELQHGRLADRLHGRQPGPGRRARAGSRATTTTGPSRRSRLRRSPRWRGRRNASRKSR